VTSFAPRNNSHFTLAQLIGAEWRIWEKRGLVYDQADKPYFAWRDANPELHKQYRERADRPAWMGELYRRAAPLEEAKESLADEIPAWVPVGRDEVIMLLEWTQELLSEEIIENVLAELRYRSERRQGGAIMTAIVENLAAINSAVDGEAPAAGDSGIMAIYREWVELEHRFNLSAFDHDSAYEVALGRMSDLENEVAEIPANTLRGLAAKVLIASDAIDETPLAKSLIMDAIRLMPELARPTADADPPA
jgi:hypothetical protein